MFLVISSDHVVMYRGHLSGATHFVLERYTSFDAAIKAGLLITPENLMPDVRCVSTEGKP